MTQRALGRPGQTICRNGKARIGYAPMRACGDWIVVLCRYVVVVSCIPETGRGMLLVLRDAIPLSMEEPRNRMKFVCDAPGGKAWFRLETDSEAAAESMLMHHAVEKYFRQEKERAIQSYHPTSKVFVEQEIGLKAHLERKMAMFLTLRDAEGAGLATAMLPPGGRDDLSFKMIIVGPKNSDPYAGHGDAIRALGQKFGLTLERSRCFPYHRS